MKTYRLNLADDGIGVDRSVEFEAESIAEVFERLGREFAGRVVEIVENGCHVATTLA